MEPWPRIRVLRCKLILWVKYYYALRLFKYALVQGKEFRYQMEQADQLAAETIFAANNNHLADDTIDLHKLRAKVTLRSYRSNLI